MRCSQGSVLQFSRCFIFMDRHGSGVLNVIKTNKHLNTMGNHWVVQIRLHILAIRLLRTTALFVKDHPVFFVGKRSNWTTKWDLWRNWTTLWRRRTTNCSRHEEASPGGGSFAPQDGSLAPQGCLFAPQGVLIAAQNLTICVSRTTCLPISTNLLSGWFYQDHRWCLINKSVVLIKQICGPAYTVVQIVPLSISQSEYRLIEP